MESYTEFMEELREKVAEKLGEGYETEIHQIAKANAGVMDALTVFQSGGKAKAGPNFYLPPLFVAQQTKVPFSRTKTSN